MQNSKLKNTGVKIKILLFVFLIFNLAFALTARGQSELPPKPAAPRSPQIPTPTEKILPNGLRVIVVERKNVPLVTAQLLVKSGGEVDPKGLAGAANMTAELLTKGTKTRTAIDIAEQIEFLGGGLDSRAGWDFSAVTFDVMSDKFGTAMAIAADTVLNPVFAQEEIDRLKTQTLDELSVSLKEPGTLANYAANVVVFGDQNYGHPLGGTPESLGKITRADLVKIHRTFYKPNNAILIVAGDIAPAAAFALSQKYFGNWGGKYAAPKTANSVATIVQTAADAAAQEAAAQNNAPQITVIDLPASGQAAVTVAAYGIARDDTDYFQGLVANSILGGGYSSRLNQEIRIKRGLSYGAGSSLSARREGGIFTTRAQTKNESAAQVAEIMMAEINRLASEAVGETELTPRKAVLIGDFSRDLETTGGLVEQIAQLALYNLPLAEINSYIQKVQNVRENQSREFVKNLFSATNATIVIVGDAKTLLPDLQKRFAGAQIQVIPVGEFDLNNAGLRKSKS